MKALARFKLEDEQKSLFQIPIKVPSGDIEVGTSTEVLLNQRIGNLVTERPIFLLDNLTKRAMFTGDGFWRWKLVATSEEKGSLFDAYWQKVFALLMEKESGQRLTIQSDQEIYTQGESVSFFAQVFNESNQSMGNQKVTLNLLSENGEPFEYVFFTKDEGVNFQLSSLPSGNYKYQAATILDGEKLVKTGKIIINPLDLERNDLRADFSLLKSVAQQSNGGFRIIGQPINEIDKASDFIVSQVEEKELKDFTWLLYLIATLLALEWGLRKYFGSL